MAQQSQYGQQQNPKIRAFRSQPQKTHAPENKFLYGLNMGRSAIGKDQPPLAVDEETLDHDKLVKKSLECRQWAELAETRDDRDRWIEIAEEFLRLAQEIKP